MLELEIRRADLGPQFIAKWWLPRGKDSLHILFDLQFEEELGASDKAYIGATIHEIVEADIAKAMYAMVCKKYRCPAFTNYEFRYFVCPWRIGVSAPCHHLTDYSMRRVRKK